MLSNRNDYQQTIRTNCDFVQRRNKLREGYVPSTYRSVQTVILASDNPRGQNLYLGETWIYSVLGWRLPQKNTRFSRQKLSILISLHTNCSRKDYLPNTCDPLDVGVSGDTECVYVI